jgi:hypothetical protein
MDEARHLNVDLHANALQIIDERKADPYIQRFLQALVDDERPSPQDTAVVFWGLIRALNTAESRKALGASPKRRGNASRYDPATYGNGSPVAEIIERFAFGYLSRPQARQALAEHTDGGNFKTLDKLLDGLCRHLGYSLPD